MNILQHGRQHCRTLAILSAACWWGVTWGFKARQPGFEVLDFLVLSLVLVLFLVGAFLFLLVILTSDDDPLARYTALCGILLAGVLLRLANGTQCPLAGPGKHPWIPPHRPLQREHRGPQETQDAPHAQNPAQVLMTVRFRNLHETAVAMVRQRAV